MKKAFFIFSVSLNLILVFALICFLSMERAEDKSENEARRESAEALKSEALILLDRAEKLYRNGDVSGACRNLGIAQYALFGSEKEEVTSLLGEATLFFADNEGESVQELFFAFIDEMKMIITGELDISQSQVAFEISSVLTDESIGDNSQGSLWEGAVVKEEAARQTAEKLLGNNLLLSSCENSIFPERYIFAGGNTYAAVTRIGGEMREALFYAGKETFRISEYKALSLMKDFLEASGYKELSVGFHFALDGIYYARFFSSGDPELCVTLGIRGSSGSICLFEAERLIAQGKVGK